MADRKITLHVVTDEAEFTLVQEIEHVNDHYRPREDHEAVEDAMVTLSKRAVLMAQAAFEPKGGY